MQAAQFERNSNAEHFVRANGSQSMKLLAYYLHWEDDKIEGARTNLYVYSGWQFNTLLLFTRTFVNPTVKSIFH